MSKSIAVVGGSLGGLTAACVLRDGGHDVTVYERSSRELEERGAGIGFLEATSRYLAQRAGVDLDTISVRTGHIRYLHRDGSVAHDQTHEYLFSSWNTVYRHLLGCFEPERYFLGHELVAFDADEAGVLGRFGNGVEVRSDALVAADGIGSIVRAQLQPQATPRYAGYVAWRGMVPEADVDPALARSLGDAITYHVGANNHILVYPIPDASGSVRPGDRLLNFVWYRNYLDGGDLDDLLTDVNGSRRDLSVPPDLVAAHHVREMKATAGARLPGQLADLVEATAAPFVQVIYDIEVERMAFGRVALLGDAAFAVRPHAAAGTAKAAEDAWQLGAALDAHDEVGEALRAWEQTQLALGRDLLERTRSIGSRSQTSNTWEPGDPDLLFGLHRAGE